MTPTRSTAADGHSEAAAPLDDGVLTKVQAARAQWPQIDPEVEAIVMRIDRAGRYIDKAAGVSLARVGLTHQEFKILKLLHSGPLAHGALCRELLVSSGVMTNRLDKLEQAGLLVRKPDPTDRRGVLLELTASGRERLDQYIDLGARRERELLETLSRDEMGELNLLLAKLLAGLESELGPPPRHRPSGAEPG